MSVGELSQKIGITQGKIDDNNTQLSRLRQEIVEHAKNYVKRELRKFVEAEVKNQPEQTKALGLDRLKEMKGKLATLLNESDDLVSNELSRDSNWPHINHKCHMGDGTFITRIDFTVVESYFTPAIQRIFGGAGKILSEYEYITLGDGRGYRPAETAWITDSSSEVKYVRSISYSGTDFENSLRSYHREYNNLHANMVALEKLEAQLSQQEASDLWEQI